MLRLVASIILTLSKTVYASNYTLGFFPKEIAEISVADASMYYEAFLLHQIGQPLVDVDSNGKLVPGVAKHWTISKSGANYRFVLNKNLRFHNRKRVVCDDVKTSLKKIRSSTNPLRYRFSGIKSVTCLSPHLLEIVFSARVPGGIYAFTSGLSVIQYRDSKKFIGSGPYRLDSKDGKLLLKPFALYQGYYVPSVESFELMVSEKEEFFKGASAKVREPDLIVTGFGSEFEHKDNYSTIETKSLIGFYKMINFKKPYWRSKENRLKLMKLLIESKKIITSKRKKDLNSFFPEGLVGFTHDESFASLVSQASKVSVSKLPRLELASLGQLPKFGDLQSHLRQKFKVGISERKNFPPSVFEKMKSSGADIYAFGWASIFYHPLAATIPFEILGLDIKEFASRHLISEADPNYWNKIGARLVTEAIVMPHSQVRTVIAYKKRLQLKKSYYQYGFRLSDIEMEK